MNRIPRKTWTKAACVIVLAGLVMLPTTQLQAKSAAKSRAFMWGVNLAGAEFGGAIPGFNNKDYTWPNELELAYYAKKNLRLVRVPFLWERMQRTPFGAIDADYLSGLQSFLANAQKYNVKVLVDCHNYCRYKDNGVEKMLGRDLDKRALGNLWKKLAPQLKTYRSLWGYDLMNEPHDLGSSQEGKDIWKNTAQDAINQIRSVDSSTRIVVSGYQWSGADNWTQNSDNLKDLIDPGRNLIYQAHQYFDADHSGTYSAQNGGYDFQKQTGGDYDRGKKFLQDYIAWLRRNNKQGIVGEFSTGSDAQWQELLKRFLLEIKTNSDVIIGCTYWAGGAWWGTGSGNERSDIEPDHAGDDNNIDNWKDRPQMTTFQGVMRTPSSAPVATVASTK